MKKDFCPQCKKEMPKAFKDLFHFHPDSHSTMFVCSQGCLNQLNAQKSAQDKLNSFFAKLF